MTKEEILYETAGLIYTEHPKVIKALTKFAEAYAKEVNTKQQDKRLKEAKQLLRMVICENYDQVDTWELNPQTRDEIEVFLGWKRV